MGISRNSKPAILIVDDARDYAEMIAELIGESFTRQIYLAKDASEALTLVSEIHQKGEFAIDAVISDIHMPGMSGHDFLLQLVQDFHPRTSSRLPLPTNLARRSADCKLVVVARHRSILATRRSFKATSLGPWRSLQYSVV